MLLHISDVEQFILYFLWHHRCTSDLAGCRVCIKMRGKTPKHSPSSPSSSSAVSLWPNIRLKSRLAGASQGYHRNWVFAWHEKILPSNYPPTMFAGAFFFFCLVFFFLYIFRPCWHRLTSFHLPSRLIVGRCELKGRVLNDQITWHHFYTPLSSSSNDS